MKIILLSFLIFTFAVNTSSISNGFSVGELKSVKIGLNKLDCRNTVSYFRIAPWIPLLSKSDIYYAHVDIYNAHQDKSDEAMIMLLDQKDFDRRIVLIKSKNVDCILYEKNLLIVDNIRVKGCEKWRYQNLYNISSNYYEDNNVVIFKFNKIHI